MGGNARVIDSTDWHNCGKSYHIRARLLESQIWAQVDFPNREISEDERDDPHMVRVTISQDSDLSAFTLPIDVNLDCETIE